MEMVFSNPVFGRKIVIKVKKEDVIKSIINEPDKWTKEQIIHFLKENYQ